MKENILNQVKPFTEPVVIPCTVYGKKMTATITGEIDNATQYQFEVKFSDGKEMIAVLDQYIGWVTDNLYPAYINAIKEQLQCFVSVYKNDFFKTDIQYNGENITVWFENKSSDSMKEFTIYFNGGYQFDLRKINKKWEAKTIKVRNPEIDEKLASVLTAWLDARK